MTTEFKQEFTTIKGLSDRRRLPRMGRIYLGYKAKKGETEYPVELPFFRLPAEVGAVYGFKSAEQAVNRAKELKVTRQPVLDYIAKNFRLLAEELEVMFPVNDRDVVFPQSLRWYGSSRGVKCIGNGETALRSREHAQAGGAIPVEGQPSDAELLRVECPCGLLKTEANPKGECVQRAFMLAMLPKVSMGGVYQITCSSFNSIVDLNSGIDFVAAQTFDRFAMIMLKLRRVPTETHHDDKKQIHYTMQLLFDVNIDTLNLLREGSKKVIAETSKFLLPMPEDLNPVMDEGETVIEGEFVEQPSMKEQAFKSIDECATQGALKAVWDTITGMKIDGRISEDDYKELAAAKDAQKKKIERADKGALV